MSKGEEQIASLLKKSKIVFEREKTFTDLRKGKYRYDFYISSYRGQQCLIEVNGQQHYKFIPAFYKSQREWQAALERDRMKISFANANRIPIYIIPFFDLPQIQSAADIFQPQYLAKNRWHNDQIRLSRQWD